MANESWGLPYMGSKNLIAKYIVDVLPGGERLVDLFAGGCAITDYAFKSTDKFSKFLVNDLNGWSPQTYIDALAGGFDNAERWVSREDFFRTKAMDPYSRVCFSFGSNCKTYAYSPDIEPYRRALHHIIFWEDYSPIKELCPQVVDIIKDYCKDKDRKGRRLASGNAITDHIKQKGSFEYWQSNPLFRRVKFKWTPTRRGMKGNKLSENHPESLEMLTSPRVLPSLNTLERLQDLEHPAPTIEATSIDYRQYEHQEGDAVYCDPPYRNTNGYSEGVFDSNVFWEWVRTRNYPVYVSEYQAPEDFVSIWHHKKRALFHGENLTAPKTEHLFIHRKFANR
jgi:hypothetical protein